ncbi:hypothetical protein NMY22_g11741 [Coprinellus aureogranulatus]|nr:hypothetical protein NMY22_g11741 [Coprinellus aureogranulatus]
MTDKQSSTSAWQTIRVSVPSQLGMPHIIPRNEADRVKEAKYQKLMDRVRSDPLITNYQAVLDYLCKVDYYGPVLKVLDSLDGSAVPDKEAKTGDPALVGDLFRAREAVGCAATEFRFLFHIGDSPTLERYRRKCVELILERWDGVCKWMTYLVVNSRDDTVKGHCRTGRISSGVSALRCCVEVVTALVHSCTGSSVAELASLPCTVDLLFTLLSHVDSVTGKYEMLEPYIDRSSRCAVTALLHATWSIPWDGKDALLLNLKSQKRGPRRRIFSSLIRRGLQMAEDANDETVLGYALSCGCLIKLVSTLFTALDLWEEMCATSLPSDMAEILAIISEKIYLAGVTDEECWDRLSTAATSVAWSAVGLPNPLRVLPKLVGSGLFSTALRCFPHRKVTSEELDIRSCDTLNIIAPYLYHEDVFFAAAKRSGVWDIVDADPPDMINGDAVPDIWEEMFEAMDKAYEAHYGELRTAVCMCSNVKVFRAPQSKWFRWADAESLLQHAEKFPVVDYVVRACSRCHWATYCCLECQEEDWVNVHQFECRNLRALAKTAHFEDAKTLLLARRSQLAYLQSIINRPEYLERLQQAKKTFRTRPNRPHIPLFSFPACVLVSQAPGIGAPEARQMDIEMYQLGNAGESERRYAQLVEDAKHDDGLLLCEGYFPHTLKVRYQ